MIYVLHVVLVFLFFTYLTSVQSFSHVQLFANPWTAATQASLSVTNSQSFLKPVSIKSVMPSNHLILWCSFLLLPSIFPSIRVFSYEPALCIRWPRYWSFSFSISPSNEYSELIYFRIDWFDLLAIQRTLKSLLNHHISKASILQHSVFFMIQLSYACITGKTVALTIRTFVGKVMSLFFMITWITVLCASMKLWAMSCRAIQDGQVMGESSDKTWSIGEGNYKPRQHSCLENPMNNMKR